MFDYLLSVKQNVGSLCHLLYYCESDNEQLRCFLLEVNFVEDKYLYNLGKHSNICSNAYRTTSRHLYKGGNRFPFYFAQLTQNRLSGLNKIRPIGIVLRHFRQSPKSLLPY